MTAELPPRPEPPRRLGDSVQAWLAWFGLARLLVSALCIVVVVAGVAWLVRAPAPATEAGLPFTGGDTTIVTTATLAPPVTALPGPTTAPTVGAVFVHVAGAVVAPGVYELDSTDRVHVAIASAGGASVDADLDGLNLAATVADGQRIYVPTEGEVDPATVPSGGDEGGGPAADPGGEVHPIDVNTATVDQFESLPGIGPATAAAIIDDRDRHGPFATVDDLERVPGIGPAKLAAIAERVTV